jgi:hypothetical protein
MKEINDGGPAFPTPDTVHANGQVQYGTFGMTLRDFFAGQALTSIATEACDMDEKARWCYRLADQMLIARNSILQ